MKLLGLLLALSLGINAAIYLQRPATPALSSNSKPTAQPAVPPAPPITPELLAQLESAEPAALEKLNALNLPEPLRIALIRAQVDRAFGPRYRALNPPPKNYWESPDYFRNTTKERLTLNREKEALLKKLLGDAYLPANPVSSSDHKLSFLSADKAARVRSINDDYRELAAETQDNFLSPRLPEDKAARDLLAREQRADLADILTPAELLDYDLRHSPVAGSLRRDLSAFEPTEAEFKALFSLTRAGFEKNGVNPDLGALNSANYFLARSQLEQSSATEAKTLLGEARYNDLIRSRDRSYQTLHQIGQRYNLPQATVIAADHLRKAYETRTNQVMNDPANREPQKRAEAIIATKAIVDEAEAKFVELLGPSGAQVFKENARLFTLPTQISNPRAASTR